MMDRTERLAVDRFATAIVSKNRKIDVLEKKVKRLQMFMKNAQLAVVDDPVLANDILEVGLKEK